MGIEDLIIKVIENYGADGIMAVALVFIVLRFDKRLEARDKDEARQREELIDIIKNNTEAMTGLKIVAENLKDIILKYVR